MLLPTWRTTLSERLRVGLLLPSLEVPAWVLAAIRDVATSDHSQVVVAAVISGSPKRQPVQSRLNMARRLRGWLQRADALADRAVPQDLDAFARQDATDLLADVEIRSMRWLPDGRREVASQDVHELRALRLDVLIWFGSWDLHGDVLGAADAGVWAFTFGDRRVKRGGPPGFWEVHEAAPVTGAALELLTGNPDERVSLARASTATIVTSIRRTRNAIVWTAIPLLSEALHRLHRVGLERFRADLAIDNGGLDFYSNRRYGSPTGVDLAVHAGRRAARSLAMLARRAFRRQQWVLLYALADDLVTAGWRFQAIRPPRDRFWADPHVLHVDGRYFVFVEELLFASGKGRIAVLELDAKGQVSAPRVVLDTPHHLSYPFVFEHEGEYFMIPESSAQGTVDLYRATVFPDRWEFVEHLMTDIDAVDATLLREDDRWWLFASVTRHRGAGSGELDLYSSERLTGGTWQLHPASPISTSVIGGRPAGAILRRNGRLYRPGQDGSGVYGRAIVLFEILELSETSYRERAATTIEPAWSARITRTHTLAHAGRLTMLDALWPRGRWG